MMMVAFDPGETTGVAEFHFDKFHRAYTLSYEEMDVALANDTWKDYNSIVIEDFLIYPWKAKHMKMDRVPAARVIGKLEFYAKLHRKDCTFLLAGQMKQFLTKDRFNVLTKKLGIDIPDIWNTHCMDAVKHGVYQIIVKRGKRK